MRSSGTLAALLSVVAATVLAGLPSTISPIAAAAAATPAGRNTAASTRGEPARPSQKTARMQAEVPVKASVKAPRTTAPKASGKSAKGGTVREKAAASSRQAARSVTPSTRSASRLAVTDRSVQPVRPARVMHSDRGAAAALAGAGIGSGAAADAALHPLSQDAGGSPSIGEAIGLHRVADPLALRSAVALVVDARSGEVLYEKNYNAVLPIASITKVMMSMVVLDARQPLGDKLTIDETDRDLERSSSSKLPMGSVLTRGELLQLALMSSENRAASALARNYPGGLSAFVSAANRKAAEIGMRDSVFMDGTGLSSSNVSTARDLALMVEHASRYPLISAYSTASELNVRTAYGTRTFRTTNRMVGSSDWDLSLQKTGYISESGNCLVMRGKVDSRPVILVLLDSYGRYSRLGDAQRIRRWLEG